MMLSPALAGRRAAKSENSGPSVGDFASGVQVNRLLEPPCRGGCGTSLVHAARAALPEGPVKALENDSFPAGHH
eukprot:1466143-Prymnesium_polylepis.1